MSPETSVPILFVLIRPIKAFAPNTPLSTFSGKGGLMPQVGLSPIFCLQDSDLISSSPWGVQLCVYLVTQWCPTLSDHPPPQTVARQTPLSMEFSRQDYWSGLPFPPPEDLPNPEIKPVSRVSCFSRRILYHWANLGSPASLLSCGARASEVMWAASGNQKLCHETGGFVLERVCPLSSALWGAYWWHIRTCSHHLLEVSGI